MAQGAKDSHLKNPPDSDNYDMKVARIRMKGFHEDNIAGNELDAIAVYPVNPFGDPIINEMQVRMVPGGTPTWVRDATTNNSDKTFTVPAGKVWSMCGLLAQITASATVGGRIMAIQITDGTNLLETMPPLGAVAATQVGAYSLQFGNGPIGTTALAVIDWATINAGRQHCTFPTLLLPGYVIHVYDHAAIDAAADDLIVVLHYIEYDA